MDIEQINNILTTTDKVEKQYSDAQWLYVQDNNNGQYQNYLQYITTTLKQQFIDYHNAYLWIPMICEVQNTSTQPGFAAGLGQAHPPLVAMRQSVLSLLGQQTVSTDQGQTLFNDINTQMINNLRLEIENDIGWVWTEGSELDYAYDQVNMVPSQNQNYNLGPAGSTTVQQAVSYLAVQGQEPGQLFSTPITNDYNEFGNNVPAIFTFTGASTGAGITVISGFTAPGATLSGQVAVRFQDGRIGYFPYTTNATAGSFASFGGIPIEPGALITMPAGTYTFQALGTSNVIDNPLQSEVVTVPINITTSGTAVTTLNTFGGVTLTTTSTAYINGLANGQIGARNPNFNKGFLDRVTIFQNTSAYVYTASGTTPGLNPSNPFGTHTYYYTAIIPLKLMHDFWMQLNIPIINVGFNITAYLNQSNGSTAQAIFPPFQTSNNVGQITGGTDATTRPQIYYGRSLNNGSGTRLYYRTVKFSPSDNALMAEKLTTGFTKSIKFISTDWITQNGVIAVGNGTTQYQITASVVHPLRVWVLAYPVNSNIVTPTTDPVTTLAIAPLGALLQADSFAPGVITGFFNQVNILVNNVPYFRQNLQNNWDLWEQLREQFNPDDGSMIRYVDWLHYKRYLCLDLTRIADRLQSPTEPVSLSFQGNRSDNLPYQLQLFYLIERENQVTFRFSASDVAIVVGNLD